jgi:hypothetical protein
VAKQTGDVGLAINHGHKIKKLWDRCKQEDSAFMPGFDIRQSVFAVDLFAPEGIDLYRALSEDNRKHYDENPELYAVAKLLANLKYWSIPSSAHPDGFRVSWLFPNPYWTRFFKALRGYLRLPLPGRPDYIRDIIGWGNLPSESVTYLTGLYD